MFQIIVFVDVEHSAQVMQALFSGGAGMMGNYDSCAFVSQGIGQFRPLKGASPFIGEEDHLEKVEEMRIEVFCQKEKLKSAVSSMLKAHPYETPAYYVVEHFNWKNV